MATNFPGSQDSFTNPTASDTLDSPDHASQHTDVNDAVEAIELALLDGAPLHIDDTNERVGVGTQSPTDVLHVVGDVTVEFSDDGSAAQPEVTLHRESSTPADGDYLGQLKFAGKNDAGQTVNYAKITGKISDVTDTTEDGLIEIATIKAGSQNIGYRLTSTDLKLLNGTGLEVDGDVAVGSVNPTSKMEVNGSIAATSRTGSRSDGSITVSYDTLESMAYVETWNSKPLRVRTYGTQYYNVSGTDKMTITSAGVNVYDDVYFNDNALISSYVTSSNVDHIWHSEGTNTWHFCSDTTYKASGNSALQAGTLNASTVNATTVNLSTSVHLTNVVASGSMRVQGDDGYIDIGPKNDTYCHIYTDRGSFYFNKTVLYANSTSNVIYHGGNSNNYNTNWTANSVYADDWFRAASDSGLYFETYGTGIRSPISEGGQFGSVATYGGEGGYEGFSIGGRTVFMHNMSTAWGIYNDVNNEWLIYGVHNAGMNLRYNGASRLAVESDRVENYSDFFETNATKFNHSYCGGGNNQIAFRWSSPYLKASVDNLTCATVANFSDERIKTDIVDWNEGMGMVRQLRPVTYTPKAIVGFGEISGTPIESPDVSNDTLIGLIAQEVGAVCPSAVARPGPDGEGLQSILPDHLFAILISAVKDIDSRLSVVEAA